MAGCPSTSDLYDDVYRRPRPGGGPACAGARAGTEEDLDRLTHLVFLDGRLLDAWTEPAVGTRWQESAPGSTANAAGAASAHGLRTSRCSTGSPRSAVAPAAVAALDDAPLTDDGSTCRPTCADVRSRHRLESVAELLDSVCAALFDAETSYAARHALLALWAETPELVLGSPSAAHLAGGILWAVGKANGCSARAAAARNRPSSRRSRSPRPISGAGGQVARALRGLLATADRPYCAWERIPDLEPLGDPGLLTSATRRQLVRLRDRAVRDRATAQVAADVTER